MFNWKHLLKSDHFSFALKEEENKKKVWKNIVGFVITMTVKWWNLSGPLCVGKVDSLCLAESLPGWHCTSCSSMEPGKCILHTFLLLKLSWESIMFAAGSPPFGTMSACYLYNPRHGQSSSVPKVWKCRHRRSVAPEEGKLESRSQALGYRWERKVSVWNGDKSIQMIRVEISLYLIKAFSFLEFLG